MDLPSISRGSRSSKYLRIELNDMDVYRDEKKSFTEKDYNSNYVKKITNKILMRNHGISEI